MTLRYPRVLDHTALVALMCGHPAVNDLLDQAERGLWNLVVPAACVADAEQQVRVGHASWDVVLSTAGVVGLELSMSASVDCGQWPGSLASRHAAFEAVALRAVVVTQDPDLYAGMLVPLLVV